ncbi:hypothetical protein QV13_05265 [Mesorhizobium hungaricum]|jgi:Protein of unknown function (DUF1419)|uniref:DUF1419 domain-containing protein n=1 Tax=Mesorhizobium hungaricum TaxID=1566387 RepID=A0A1C2E793_9HYPH|nr:MULTISPECIES: DUF1419 domain-containing protein [Mesorhizobium]MBN9237294.1 DUF1419 domain-containing protein [Mesorhizobium sp.]MDQ0333219.1 hypothetical protein [Mesorhizobium sp. YL-MeA3-2017]OCX22855.1 hypothetical protein QV13_05265 [Mesorhizobium hungaricum]
MTSSPIRKIYQGIADRRQMFRMFDRHAQRPSRFEDDAAPLYRGEWFEVSQADHNYMFELLPPLWMRYGMFAMREFLTGNVTSVFFTLRVDDRIRYFHGYCDLNDRRSPDLMRDIIVERESRPVRAMTREERIEHIWSSTHDDYRGYADWRFPITLRGKRVVIVYLSGQAHPFKLLDQLTDDEVASKLPVHLRHLPHAIAA